MLVHVEPTGLYSPAMKRVSRALARYAPERFTVTTDEQRADLTVLHVIDDDVIELGERLDAKGQRYAVIQYCLKSSRSPDPADWVEFWNGAEAVWSYYDLSPWAARFHHAPLGIDSVFTEANYNDNREPLIVTTGHVSGEEAEAIEEVWTAAQYAGVEAIHVGPSDVEGMTRPDNWRSVSDLTDAALARLYGRASWVSALRHIEGFEMPGIEGLACGARPIVFDQPSMRHWYEEHAIYVAECSGDALADALVLALSNPPQPVTEQERELVVETFDWRTTCEGFWRKVVDSVEVAA